MKWLDQWLYAKIRDMWDNRHKYETNSGLNMAIGASQKVAMDSRAEGEDRISFDLSSAVGGRILNVRRYDSRTDRHNQTTYVIPTGEDIGQRVAKIINLELIK